MKHNDVGKWASKLSGKWHYIDRVSEAGQFPSLIGIRCESTTIGYNNAYIDANPPLKERCKTCVKMLKQEADHDSDR